MKIIIIILVIVAIIWVIGVSIDTKEQRANVQKVQQKKVEDKAIEKKKKQLEQKYKGIGKIKSNTTYALCLV